MKRAQYQIANISFHQSVINVTYQTIDNLKLKFSFIHAVVKIFKKPDLAHVFRIFNVKSFQRIFFFIIGI